MKTLVIGASKGLGRALTTSLLENGHHVFGIARSDELLSNIKKSYQNFEFKMLDFAQPGAPEDLSSTLNQANFFPENVYFIAAISRPDQLINKAVRFEEFAIRLNQKHIIKLIELLSKGPNPPNQYILASSIFAKMEDVSYPIYTSTKRMVSHYFEQQSKSSSSIGYKVVYFGPIQHDVTANSQIGISSVHQAANALLSISRSRLTSIVYPGYMRPFLYVLNLMPKRLYRFIFLKLRRN